MSAVAELIESYYVDTGFRPSDRQLDLLADYILREELTDTHPDKMTREEYPIMSEWQRTRRLKTRFLVGAAEIDYARSVGFKRSHYVDKDNVHRASRRRIVAFP